MMFKLLILSVLLGATLLIVSCATGEQTDRPYQEIGRSKHFTLESDGIIIGFEKRSIRRKNAAILGEYQNQPLYANLAEPLTNEDGLNKKRNKLFRRYAYFNSKIMMPTQIVCQFDQRQTFVYNAYDTDLGGHYDYTESFEQLKVTFQQLKTHNVGGGKYTHIIVMNMGWNNDQAVSLWRYNTMIRELRIRAQKTGDKFNPFVVAITWPSVWRSINDFTLSKKLFHMISYPNKTLDADELGVTWMNWIINDQLPRLIDKTKADAPKLVLIGHSLGARILSRAVFATDHLLENKESDAVDLLIGLQPAFSATRFVTGKGLEGSPYAEFRKKKTRLVFTTSVNDDANPVANYITGAKHLGGRKGLAYARKHAVNTTAGAPYDIQTWSDQSLEEVPSYDKGVVLIDASSIVEDNENQKLSAHNDILDDEMAELIWHHISALE